MNSGRLVVKTVVLAALAVLLAAKMPEALEKPAVDRENFAAWLKEAVKEKVMAKLSGAGREVGDVEVTVPENVRAPEDFDAYDISIPSQNRKGEKIHANIAFLKNGRAVMRIAAAARVDMTMNAVVAARDLKHGAIIEEEDLRIEKVSIGAEFEKIVTDPAKIVGKQSARNLKAGAPLRLDHVSQKKMISAGETVTIVAGNATIRVSTPGKAKQDGDKGDWIKVVNMDSGKSLNAKVSGPGEVTVEF
ncbi:MAG: flagellar basal body P-ring formation protein FlgA [Nitrospinae bacterium]|nr:flagellar basal body P-ring formation protein FlgA [Nitrospinota bacterium]